MKKLLMIIMLLSARLTFACVVHIKSHAGQRYITGIDFDPMKNK